jgi:predicted porin
MNKNIKLAVAGAVLALSASAANAGIIIPAGDWTIDINGNVNAFVNYTHADSATGTVTGGVAKVNAGGPTGNKLIGISTGLLPSWLGFTGKTRQNDLDVEFTISMQPQASENSPTGDGATYNSGGTLGLGGSNQFLNRQAYVSFGDKSWGSIKLGKDIGIFASDAILNDITLLGVGGGAGVSGNGATNATIGGIGTGYIYAAWKGQVAYTTPNMNGFQATVGIVNPNMQLDAQDIQQDRFGLEGKASYSFAQGDLNGKVWVSGATYDVTYNQSTGASYTASAGDIGATVSSGPFGVTGYYYAGKGVGTTFFGSLGASSGNRRDSDGGYIQGTYVLPTKTKLGLAYGVSNLDKLSSDATTLVDSNERYTVGLYHPLTKHLNVVAEYNNLKTEAHSGLQNESQTYSAGAILFF